MMFENLQLISIILLGIISSYTDLKDGVIYTRIVNLFIPIGVLFNMGIAVTTNNVMVILYSILGVITGVIIGYTLNYLGLWAAGDTNLLAAYGAIVPYQFLGLSIFLNAMLIAAPIIIVISIIGNEKKKIHELQRGEIPNTIIRKTENGIKRIEPKLENMNKENNIIEPHSDGLDKEDINKLKELQEKDLINNKIEMRPRIKYAPFLFLGALTLHQIGDIFYQVMIGLL